MVLVFHGRIGLMKSIMKRKREREREREREWVSVNKSAKRVKDKHYKWDKGPVEPMFIIIRTTANVTSLL